jgi:hypothetical protein
LFGSFDVAKLLLEIGVSIEEVDAKSRDLVGLKVNLLVSAIYTGKENIVALLIANNASMGHINEVYSALPVTFQEKPHIKVLLEGAGIDTQIYGSVVFA